MLKDILSSMNSPHLKFYVTIKKQNTNEVGVVRPYPATNIYWLTLMYASQKYTKEFDLNYIYYHLNLFYFA